MITILQHGEHEPAGTITDTLHEKNEPFSNPPAVQRRPGPGRTIRRNSSSLAAR